MQTHDSTFGKALLESLASESALRKFLSATVVEEWATASSAAAAKSATPAPSLIQTSTLASRLSQKLLLMIAGEPSPTYSELSIALQRIQVDCHALYSAFESQGKVPSSKVPQLSAGSFSSIQANQAISGFEALIPLMGKGTNKTVLPALEERKKKLVVAMSYHDATKATHDRQVFAALGGAVVALRVIPAKVTPIIRSITTSIKVRLALRVRTWLTLRSGGGGRESAGSLSQCDRDLYRHLLLARVDAPHEPVRQDCQEPMHFPLPGRVPHAHLRHLKIDLDRHLLARVQAGPRTRRQGDERVVARVGRSGGCEARLPWRSTRPVRAGGPVRRELAGAGPQAVGLHVGRSSHDVRLWFVAPLSRSVLTDPGDVAIADGILADDLVGQDLLDCLTVLPIAAEKLGVSLQVRITTLFPALCLATRSRIAVVRYATARCFAALCNIVPIVGLRQIVEQVIPVLGDPLNVDLRRGAIELISRAFSLPLSTA